ncbi:MAG: hypothetical protein PHP70_11140 [Gallionella sp.]|nr:hypothetical protein [Gallionella sp.]
MTLPLPKTHKQKAWERPEPKGIGDPKHETLWEAIGAALTTWELAEDVLASIFSHVVESKSSAAKRAFGAIQSHRGRTEALVAAAEVYFAVHQVSDELQEDLRLLLDHFGYASARRNEVAHAVIVNFKVSTVEHNFLVPPEHSSKKSSAFKTKNGESSAKLGVFQTDYRYTSQDIFGFASKFELLLTAAKEYLHVLSSSHPRQH